MCWCSYQDPTVVWTTPLASFAAQRGMDPAEPMIWDACGLSWADLPGEGVPDDGNPLDPARGIVWGLALSALLWLPIGILVAALV